jgi:pilus assembly protein CpaC
MSKRRINLMRLVVESILVALAMLVLGSLRPLVAETPKPPAPSHRTLLPFEFGLQGRLVLATPVERAPLVNTVRVVRLPARAPLAASALATMSPSPAAMPTPLAPRALLNPAELLIAMRTFVAPRTAAAPVSAPLPAPLGPPGFALPRPVPEAIDLQLTTHHSLVVQSPVALSRVSITDPAIAQAIVVSPSQVLVQGNAPGEVSLLLWDANDNATAYTVEVGLDPIPLQRELLRLYPRQLLRVTASGDALTVTGTLPNAATAKQVLAVAAGFSKNVVNNLSTDPVEDPGQVLLQVRFAEVDRSAISQFGVNLLSTGRGAIGGVTTGQFGPPNSLTAPTAASVPLQSVTGSGGTIGLSSLLNVFLYNSNTNLGALIQALQQKNLLQILAEPNLLAMDGKEASFLAGGEFPFPVVQGQGSVNNVTIQFKPFGVNLHFKPTILPDGEIDLQVAPEVSALDFSNALTVSGFQIPALSTRRAETELELGDGQSFVIAGLMDNRLTTNLSKLPGVSSLPILGKLFESHNINRSTNELMVVVTAHVVHPTATPATGPKMPQPFLLPEQFDKKDIHP